MAESQVESDSESSLSTSGSSTADEDDHQMEKSTVVEDPDAYDTEEEVDLDIVMEKYVKLKTELVELKKTTNASGKTGPTQSSRYIAGDDVRGLKVQNENLKRELQENQKQYQETIERLQSQLSNASRKDRGGDGDSFDTDDETNSNVWKKYHKLKEDYLELKKLSDATADTDQLRTSQNVQNELKIHIENLTRQLDEKLQSENLLASKNAESKEIIERLRLEIESLKIKDNEHQLTIDRLNTQLSNVRSEAQAVNDLEKTIKELTHTNEKLQNELDSLREHKNISDSLETELLKFKAECEKLAVENHTIKSELNCVREKLSNANTNDVNDQCSKYEEIISKLNEKYEASIESYKRVDLERKSLRQKLETKMLQLDQRFTAASGLAEAYKNVCELFENTRIKYTNLKSEYNQLRDSSKANMQSLEQEYDEKLKQYENNFTVVFEKIEKKWREDRAKKVELEMELERIQNDKREFILMLKQLDKKYQRYKSFYKAHAHMFER